MILGSNIACLRFSAELCSYLKTLLPSFTLYEGRWGRACWRPKYTSVFIHTLACAQLNTHSLSKQTHKLNVCMIENSVLSALFFFLTLEVMKMCSYFFSVQFFSDCEWMVRFSNEILWTNQVVQKLFKTLEICLPCIVWVKIVLMTKFTSHVVQTHTVAYM